MYERWGKRAFDLVAAAMLLALLAPLFVVVALAVRIALGRPVLFRQTRAGRGGGPFVALKFRSMSDGPGDDAARLGRFGRALRASSLDELPQLCNILRGDMSLVGPRPLPLAYVPRYAPRQALRLRVRPGLAGLAQAAGRNAVPWDRRFELDARYAERVTLRGDLGVLWRCLLLVLLRQGITAAGHATMPPFAGDAGVARAAPDPVPSEPAAS